MIDVKAPSPADDKARRIIEEHRRYLEALKKARDCIARGWNVEARDIIDAVLQSKDQSHDG